MFREIDGRQLGDSVKELDVNLAIWRMFMNTTLRAPVRFEDFDMKLRFVEN